MAGRGVRTGEYKTGGATRCRCTNRGGFEIASAWGWVGRGWGVDVVIPWLIVGSRLGLSRSGIFLGHPGCREDYKRML